MQKKGAKLSYSKTTTGQLQLILRSFNLPSDIRKQLELILTDTTNISDQIVEHFLEKMSENDQTSAGERREFLRNCSEFF